MAHTKLTKRQIFTRIILRLFLITIGACIYALGLEGFLIPNSFMDGGVTGISIMISSITGGSLSLFLILLNIPFLFFAYKLMGKKFTIFSLYGIIVLSIATALFRDIPAFTDEMLLATIFGGGMLGIGLGIVIRYGAAMDGSEILGVLLASKLPFNVSDFIMAFNVIVFICGGFVFGGEAAMYSVLAYMIAAKLMDTIVDGFNELSAFHIITDHVDEMGTAIVRELGKTVTYLSGEGGYSGNRTKIIYVVVSRLEEAQLRDLIDDIDEHAFVSVSTVNEVKGQLFKQKTA